MRLCDLHVRFDCLSHQFGVSGIRDRTVERQSSQIIYAELEAAVRLSPESESFFRNWLTLTRQLCGQKTHTKKWRYAGCLGQGYFVTSRCQS
jgi:hypothetical protein